MCLLALGLGGKDLEENNGGWCRRWNITRVWHLLSERLAQGGCRWWSEELNARKVNSAQGEWGRLGWSQTGSLEPSRSTFPELELPLTPLVMNVLISCPAVSWLFSLNGFNEYTFKYEQIHLTLELFKLLFLVTVCRILVPRPRIEPMPLALEVWNLNPWTTKEVPNSAAF